MSAPLTETLSNEVLHLQRSSPENKDGDNTNQLSMDLSAPLAQPGTNQAAGSGPTPPGDASRRISQRQYGKRKGEGQTNEDKPGVSLFILHLT
jgi:hypothetical protein